MFLLVPSILILGAIIQPYLPRSGRWILSGGALLVSLYVLVFLAPQAVGIFQTLRVYHGVRDLMLLSLFIVTILLVGWCDVALVTDAARLRHSSDRVVDQD